MVLPSAPKIEYSRRWDCAQTVSNFGIRGSGLEYRWLVYAQESSSNSNNPRTPNMPTTPLLQAHKRAEL